MRDDGRGHHPEGLVREVPWGSALLNAEAVGLAALAAALLGAGLGVAAAVCLALAAVAGGLGASIGEGLPRSGGAVVGFEGVVLAFAASQVSGVGAVAVLAATGAAVGWRHRRDGVRQIRRPVPCQ